MNSGQNLDVAHVQVRPNIPFHPLVYLYLFTVNRPRVTTLAGHTDDVLKVRFNENLIVSGSQDRYKTNQNKKRQLLQGQHHF